jgi:hypothetical protein
LAIERDFAGPCIVDRRRAGDLDRRIAFELAAEASRQFTESHRLALYRIDPAMTTR